MLKPNPYKITVQRGVLNDYIWVEWTSISSGEHYLRPYVLWEDAFKKVWNLISWTKKK